jgi:hypothetical protein
MNSYQTANAAFAAAGLRPSEGVKHGRGYFFRKALGDLSALEARVIAHMALDLTLDYDDTKRPTTGRWNAEDKERQLRLIGGIAAAKAGGTSKLRWVVLHKPEGDGDEFDDLPWKVYDTQENPQMAGIRGRSSWANGPAAVDAARFSNESAP